MKKHGLLLVLSTAILWSCKKEANTPPANA